MARMTASAFRAARAARHRPGPLDGPSGAGDRLLRVLHHVPGAAALQDHDPHADQGQQPEDQPAGDPAPVA